MSEMRETNAAVAVACQGDCIEIAAVYENKLALKTINRVTSFNQGCDGRI
jgi:hypothetical protein